MDYPLRSIHQQVIFITGATSSVGRKIVLLAAEQGAKVFMLDQNEDELQLLQDEMRRKSLETAFAVADVTELDQVSFAADRCIQTFGRIDTWINNAQPKNLSRLHETEEEETKRIFETVFWGLINGSRTGISHLMEKGGSILNVTGTLSGVSLPIQGIQSASRQAVQTYTEELRKELRLQSIPINVVLIDHHQSAAEAILVLLTKKPRNLETISESFISAFRPALKARSSIITGSLALLGAAIFLGKKTRI